MIGAQINPFQVDCYIQPKKDLMKNIISCLLVILVINTSQAQILGRVFDRATDRISDRISDEINDAIYREIEKATVRAVDDAMDDMLKDKYREDSISGRTGSADYDGFLKAFLTPVDLPATYTFDMVLLADTRDYDGEKSQIEFMLTEDGSLMGLKQMESDQPVFVIFDLVNDVMATYQEEDGKKTVTAIANVMSIGGSYIKANVDEENKMTFEKTAKTKKIVGYESHEYLIEDETTSTKAYIAESFPISWKESHSKFLSYMLPTTTKESMPEGMALMSESKTKKKNKKSSFEVQKVVQGPIVFDNTAYEQIDLSTSHN